MSSGSGKSRGRRGFSRGPGWFRRLGRGWAGVGLCLGLASAAGAATGHARPRLEGRLLLDANQPARSAFLRWTRDAWEVGRTQTDTNGCFAIDWDGEAGLYSLWSRKDTWELRRDNLPIPAGGTNLGDVRLLESASFQGTLRAYDRSPVVAAVVEAVWTGPDLPRTNLAAGPVLAARTEGPLRIPGLVGEYYRVPEGIRELDPSGILGNPMFRRVDAAIDFDAFFGEVAGSGLEDHVWVRWTGFLRIVRPGRYRFYLECDDGACLWIGGRKVVDNDRLHTQIER